MRMGVGLSIGGGGASWTPLSSPYVRSWWSSPLAASDTILNGGDVSTWVDRGPLAKNVTQATGGNQPLLVAGPPAYITFTTANADRLAAAAGNYDFLHRTGGGFICARFRVLSGSTNGIIAGTSTALTAATGSGFSMRWSAVSSGQVGLHVDANGAACITAYSSGASTAVVSTWFTGLVWFNDLSTTGHVSEIFVNDVLKASTVAVAGAPTANAASNAMTVGSLPAGTSPFGGDLADIVVGTCPATSGPPASLITQLHRFMSKRVP